MRLADFSTLAEALDHAAKSDAGLGFYSGHGKLLEALAYRDLRTEAVSLARGLLGMGVRSGARVGLVAETDANFVRAFFACQYAALVPVPLPLPPPFGERSVYVANVRRMLASARTALTLTPAPYRAMIQEASGRAKSVHTFEELRELTEAAVDLPEIREDGLSYLQFSSGSTRAPAGVGVTQRAVLTNIRGIIRDALKLRAGDRSLSWLPFYHDMGLVGFLLAPLAGQVPADYIATREFAVHPLIWPTMIGRNGSTVSYSPSFGYELCALRAAKSPIGRLDLSRWRVAGIGGDMIRAEALERFTRAFAPYGFRKEALLASYGMAEATLGITFAPLDRGLAIDHVDLDHLQKDGRAQPPVIDGNAARTRDFVVCGRALPGLELEIRDTDGAPQKERELGRIMVRGASVMRGYFANAQETARVLSQDGWLDTGDIGYLIGDSLVVTGRAKDLILINGRNVWPQDLEWAVEHDVEGVREGDVVAFSIDGGAEERVILLVECRKADAAAREHLRRAVTKAVLASARLRCTVVLVPHNTVPKTSSGKLARARARELYLASLLGEAPDAPASTSAEALASAPDVA